MDVFLEVVTSFPTVVYSVLLLVMLIHWLMTMLGVLEIDAIDGLLSDEPRRQRMARNAPQRVGRFSLANTFDAFWQGHADAVMPKASAEDDLPAVPPGVRVHA